MKRLDIKRNIFGESGKVFARDLLHDVIGSVLFAAGIYTFASGASFAPGGISGLALIINHYLPFLRIGLCTLILNVPVILICFRVLGKRFFFKSLKSMVLSALFMDLIFPLFPTYSGEPFLAALFAGALSGAGLALIYMRDSSTGGTDFIIMSLRKKFPHMSIGTISFAVDGIVIVIGGFVFGNINAVLYGVLMTFVSTTVIDKLMYGSGSQKMLLVISDRCDEIANSVSLETERGATIMRVTGAYTGLEHKLMLCVCSKTEVFKARAAVHRIDREAMVMICTADEAYGLGFNRIES
ncbi:MAG: YitT family protein [Clostridia bacterium]|nr:YitT family protein [Clostridia bacterium]